jgi:hypothetical protein
MPKFTFVQYEGDDAQIAQIVGRLISSDNVGRGSESSSNASGPSAWDAIGTRFEQLLSRTAAGGRPSQKLAFVVWLRNGGEVELTKLWKAAGVDSQHDYGGVGGSLSKNMRKAGGPKDWYDCYRNGSGEWIYKLLPELVEPLKRAFSIK